MYGFKLNSDMDNARHQSYPESLKTTLSCYKLSSQDSLSGPSSLPALVAQLWYKDNDNTTIPNPRPPLVQIPFLMPNDTSAKRSETYLGKQPISCFIIGGEKRLCLPQILTTVLKDYSISEINKTCADLHIYCSRCTPDQLEILMVLGILPFNTTQCGLITKTDAERLIAALGVDCHLNGRHDITSNKAKGLQVYHECFGRGDGVFYPDLYLAPDAPCVACVDCGITFSPAKFVSHSHRGLEKRTCHWGFDSENWRHYILLPKDIEKQKRKILKKELNILKAKFDPGQTSKASMSPNVVKRKLARGNEEVVSAKKLKQENTEDSFLSPMCLSFPYDVQSSAFKPWPTTSLPAGVPHLPELQSAQEDAILKAFGPVLQDRRLLPAYLQLGAPALADLHNPAEWLAALRTARDVPNIRLAPAEAQRRTASIVMDSQRKRDAYEKLHVGASPPRLTYRSNHSLQNGLSAVKTEVPELPPSLASSSSYRRRVSEEASRENDLSRNEATSVRRGSDPLDTRSNHSRSDFKKSSSHEMLGSSTIQLVANGHDRVSKQHDNETEEVDVVGDSSRANARTHPQENKTVPPLIAMSNDVEAASAMLELSSSVKETRKPLRYSSSESANHVTLSPPPLLQVKSNSHPSSKEKGRNDGVIPSYFRISSLDGSKKHFKWTFPSATFILTAEGSRELSSFHEMLNSSRCSDVVQEKLMYEVVRMKAYHEDKLSIQSKIQRDTELELEQLKASKDQCVNEAKKSKQELRKEMERMRANHHSRINEANKSLIDLGKELVNSRINGQEDRESIQHKILDRLYRQVDDREETVHHLEKQLLDERDRRILAESKLDELLDDSRRRLPFLMDGGHPVVMRNFRKRHGRVDISHQAPRTPADLSSNHKRSDSNDGVLDMSTSSNRLYSSNFTSLKKSGVDDVTA